MRFLERLEAIQRGGPQLVAALLGIGGVTTFLFLGAVFGALAVDEDGGTEQLSAGDLTEAATTTTLAGVDPGVVAAEETTPETTVPGAAPAPSPNAPAPTAAPRAGAPGASTVTTAAPAAGGGGGGGPAVVAEAPPAPGEAPLPRGGNATGVTDKTIKYGVHGPVTFNKAPVPLAGPVIRGIKTYVQFLNQNGGINGRTIDPVFADDEFTTGGAEAAGEKLINDEKSFFVAGTLGVDQIQVVANQAKKAGVPYFAGGGHEPQFKEFGVRQILSSYDTHFIEVAKFMGKDPKYAGKNVGVIVSDTPLINPGVTNLFKAELERNGLT